MKKNQDYKNAALAALKGNWAPSLVATIVLVAIMYVIMVPYVTAYVLNIENLNPDTLALIGGCSMFMYLGLIFLFFPLDVGYTNAFNALYVEGDDRITGNTFRDAFGQYLKNVWAMFLMVLFVSLWSMLLLIPGIVKAYSYAMLPYILKDNPELSAMDAIRLSSKMMKGHKFDLFYLQLSFIGWAILAVLTGGIGLLWLQPYMMTTQASFYQDIKKDFISTNINN